MTAAVMVYDIIICLHCLGRWYIMCRLSSGICFMLIGSQIFACTHLLIGLQKGGGGGAHTLKSKVGEQSSKLKAGLISRANIRTLFNPESKHPQNRSKNHWSFSCNRNQSIHSQINSVNRGGGLKKKKPTTVQFVHKKVCIHKRIHLHHRFLKVNRIFQNSQLL